MILKNSTLPCRKLIHSSLASIHLTLFVKKELVSKILDIHTDKVATGVAAFFGNKGGVGIAFTYLGTTFLFVTCHLAGEQLQNFVGFMVCL